MSGRFAATRKIPHPLSSKVAAAAAAMLFFSSISAGQAKERPLAEKPMANACTAPAQSGRSARYGLPRLPRYEKKELGGRPVHILKVWSHGGRVSVYCARPRQGIAVAAEKQAYAAVNGTFYDEKSGTPLGRVVVDCGLKNEPTEEFLRLRPHLDVLESGQGGAQSFRIHGGAKEVAALNLNTATRRELEGIFSNGSAQKIISFREKHKFGTVRQLPHAGVPWSEFARAKRKVTVNGHAAFVPVSTDELDAQDGGGWKVRFSLGGGGMLVKDGLIPDGDPARHILVSNHFSDQRPVLSRHSTRTGVGVSRDGRELVLVVGYLSLAQLANELRASGAENAMFLDGGSSSRMIVADEHHVGPHTKWHTVNPVPRGEANKKEPTWVLVDAQN